MSKSTGFGRWGSAISFSADRKWDQSPAGVYSSNLSYPTGNLASDGSRPVRQDSVSFDGSWTNLTDWAVSGNTVYARTTSSVLYGTIYGNGYATTSETGFQISGSYGLAGVFYWSTVPAQMSAPTVTPNTSTSGRLDVSFSTPDDGGTGITGYSVYLNGSWNHNTTSTSTYISGLSTGTYYTVAVAAYNAVGTATKSAATGATTIAVPTAPTFGTISRTGRSLSVPVNTTSGNGATVTSYTVRYQTSTDNINFGSLTGTQTIIGANGATLTFSNLDPAKYYKFNVYATSAIGNSSQTTSSSIFVPAGGKRYDAATSQFVSTSTAKRYNGATSQWVDINTAKRYNAATSQWVDLG